MAGSFSFILAHSCGHSLLLFLLAYSVQRPWPSRPVFLAACACHDEDSRARNHASGPFAPRSPAPSCLPRVEASAARDRHRARSAARLGSWPLPVRQRGHSRDFLLELLPLAP